MSEPPQCPVEHGRRAQEQPSCSYDARTHLPSLSNSAQAGQKETLPVEREDSSIPRTDGGVWVYPSQQMFFNAMQRKQWDPQTRDMGVVVPIHNAVNEMAWAKILLWEREQQSECKTPTLTKFIGRPKDISPKAYARSLLGYTLPFDRHDWTINRCGQEITYVIDFYTGKAVPNAAASFYLDVRPKLDTWEGVKMRCKEFWREMVSGDYGLQKQTKRPRPIERCLPENIQDIVPDSRLYKQLLQTEKRLDSTILLKKLAIQDALAKPIKLRRTLRIYVSNTTADQLRVTEGGNMEYSAGAPSWTLRIEGRLLDPQNVSTRSKQTHQQQQYTQAATPKFSRFVKHMVVELDRDQTLYPDSNIIEYHALQGQTDFDERDGFEIKRQGDRNVNARIVISMDYGPDRYKMAPELAEVVGHDIGETSKSGLDQLVNKAQIVLTLWQYVKLHKLQDTDDRRVIRCDAQLRKLFNADKVLFPQVPDLVTLWLLPPDPIVINYTIKVDTDNVASRQAYDIEVEMDDLATIQSLQGVTGLSDLNKEIMQLDDQITTAITTLSNHKLKRDFLCAFAADPVRFIDQFVASQSRDLEIMLGDQRVNREEARQSQFYRQVWVKDAVQTFMASKV